VIGSGSVAETTCRALAFASPQPLRVVVLGRSRDWVDDLTGMANAVAGAAGTGVSFTGDVIEWADEDCVASALDRHRSRLIFHTASLQSPWELLGDVDETQWKNLVWSAGHAITLPLQLPLIQRVAYATSRLPARPTLVNACCPDWINPILHHFGLPVTCGTGNIGMFSSFLKAAYPASDVRTVGHLYHYFKILGQRHSGLDGPRVWIDDKEVSNPEKDLAPVFHRLRSVNARGKLINEVVGATSAKVIAGLLGDTEVHTHVPGPNALAGGYPVRIRQGEVALDLPSECTEAEAVSLNEQGGYDMGAGAVDQHGFIPFSSTAERLLREHLPDFSSGFHFQDLPEACAQFSALRDRLRRA
jgi:hypothetical protein